MKTKLIYSAALLSLFIGSQSFAQKKLNELTVLCVTEIPTTSFIALPNQENVTFKLVNSNGVDFMPIASGIVTTYDLPILKAKSDILKGLGTEAVFSFPVANCELFSDETFRCHGESVIKGEDGVQIEATSISSQKLTTKTMGHTFEQTILSAYFRVNNQYYDVTMKYAPHECGITAK